MNSQLKAPFGHKWCPMHNGGEGGWVPEEDFPKNYSYCYECKRAYQKAWDKVHRPNIRAKNKQKVFDTLGRKCAVCGESNMQLLKIYPRTPYYKVISSRYPAGVRLLCRNCEYLVRKRLDK